MPLHPFLFAIFPILSLYENSIRFVSENELIIPLIVVLTITGIFFIVLKKLFKNNYKSELITSILILFGLFYGTLYFFIDDFTLNGIDIGKHRYLLLICFILISIIFYWIIKKQNDLRTINYVLNLVSLTMVLVIFSNILFYEINNDTQFDNTYISDIQLTRNPGPDIYFIMLDGYPGNDSLKKNNDYDNVEFISNMESIGFVNQKKFFANYPHTFLSLPSMLNMKYLNYLTPILKDSRDQSIPYSMGSNNDVMNIAKNLGYLTVSFDSGWGFTRDMKSSELKLCGDNQFFNSEFIINIAKHSILNPIYVKLYETDHLELKLCAFENLPLIKQRTNSPLFVFAHIFLPHPPYYFDSNGKINDMETLDFNLDHPINLRKDLFLEQLLFTNNKVFDVSQKIIEINKNSVIIITSDHGTAFTFEGKEENWASPTDDMILERMDNIFLIYEYDKDDSKFQNLHSSVNIFRYVFSNYFEQDLPLLPDRIYFNEDGYYDLMNKTKLFFN